MPKIFPKIPLFLAVAFLLSQSATAKTLATISVKQPVEKTPAKITEKTSAKNSTKAATLKNQIKPKVVQIEKNETLSAKTPIAHISPKLWYTLSLAEIDAVKKINNLLDNKNYDEAMIQARQLKTELDKIEQTSSTKNTLSEAIIDMVLWKKFAGNVDVKNTSFSDISRFALDNPFYPTIASIRHNVEKIAVANDISYQATEQYFKSIPAVEVEAKVYVLKSKIDALQRSNLSQTARDLERRNIRELTSKIWVKENFSHEEERNFLMKYGNQLGELDHINRIDRLLFEGRVDDAKRMMHLVNEDYLALFNAVIEMQNSPKFIDKIYLSVPRKLRNNEGLTFRRILWYKSKDKVDDVIELLLDLPEKSIYPEKWWSLRRLYGREMIKQKKYKIAYKLMAPHNLPKTSSDFWEAEWSAGWIALRFLDDSKTAYAHFENLYKNVSQPVTLSRATYWLGMAAEASGNKQQAIDWYKMSTRYPIFFYGQLAIHKHRTLDPVGSQDDIILPKDPDITERDLAKISESRAAQVAYLLNLIGEKDDAAKVFEWVVNNSPTDGQIAVIMKLVNETGDRQMDARISRIATKKNVFFIKDKFQIVREVSKDEYAPLVHAIIKQESGFAPTAVSQVGALGFMQLMPATAKLVAKEMKIPYDKQKLATDIHYNVRLGSFYIKKLIDRFDGSEMLAIASYNAGPNATQRWINEFYDPRNEKDIDKVVDWIELITYSETRNYVQRIMENLIVYKYLMSRSNYDSVK